MSRQSNFCLITGADFIVRSAYQMGKTPLLPIYAAMLGASDAFLGFIVSVSALTGLALKPFIGVLSDRWGRRAWLLVGTVFFAGMPFVYRFVSTPEQLFAVRIAHGMATAIYGPVTLAYVAELSSERRAERLGWFSLARNGGYVVGPAAAGWMLLSMSPVLVFTIVGLMSSAAFLPVLLLSESRPADPTRRRTLPAQIVGAFKEGARTSAVWLSGGLDASMYVALYAAKAFVPIYALSIGVNVAVAGAFFAVQELVHLCLNPLGGRLGDRVGYINALAVGMCVLGLALLLLTFAKSAALLMAPAVLMGVAQAMAFPSTLALVSNRVSQGNLGAGMGLIGTLKNTGKVAGPVMGGLLITWLDFTSTFRLLGIALVLAAVALMLGARVARDRSQGGQRAQTSAQVGSHIKPTR